MPRFSLRSLIVVVGVLSVLLAIWVSPRGKITSDSAAKIENGMPIYEASRIVGLQPGWYDGINGVSEIALADKANDRVAWINWHGAIVADLGGGCLHNATFTPSSEFSISGNFASMIYDRTAQRIFDSRSVYATILILCISLVIAFAPAIIMSQASKCGVAESLSFGFLVSALVFAAVSIYLNDSWIGHHNQDFPLLVTSIAFSAFMASTILMINRISRAGGNNAMSTRPSDDNNRDRDSAELPGCGSVIADDIRL